MENTKHYIYVKGTHICHSCVGSYQGEDVEMITAVGDFYMKKLENGELNDKYNLGGTNTPNVFSNGDFSLAHMTIVVKDWHKATATEKRKYNKVLKDNNMCFKTHKVVGKTVFGKPYETENEVLCWNDTEKMPISVNGKMVTLAEFRKMTFGESMNVVNSWDNGYSHWGAETNKMQSVYNLINNICSEWTEDANDPINTNWRGGRVHCGELWTWNFDKHGVLKLNLTEQEIHESYVSNT